MPSIVYQLILLVRLYQVLGATSHNRMTVFFIPYLSTAYIFIAIKYDVPLFILLFRLFIMI